MTNQKHVWVLTIVLWAIMLIVYTFFCSGASGTAILSQGDLILALVMFVIIGIGLSFNTKLIPILNYAWGTMTLTWVLVANTSRLVSTTRMEILDAVNARMLFVINEWWIIVPLCTSGLVTVYYLFKHLKAEKLVLTGEGKRERITLAGISILIPVLWCLTLNLRD